MWQLQEDLQVEGEQVSKTRQAKALDRIKNRVCDAAVRIDEYLHTSTKIPRDLRRELCDAVDDYLAGEELPRNEIRSK